MKRNRKTQPREYLPQKRRRISLTFDRHEKSNGFIITNASGECGFQEISEDFEILTKNDFSSETIPCKQYYFDYGSYYDFTGFSKWLVEYFPNAQKDVTSFLRKHSELTEGNDYFTLAKKQCVLTKIKCTSKRIFSSYYFLKLFVNYLNTKFIKKEKNKDTKIRHLETLLIQKNKLIVSLNLDNIKIKRKNNKLVKKVKDLESIIYEQNKTLRAKGSLKYWIDKSKEQLTSLKNHLIDEYESMNLDQLIKEFSFNTWISSVKSIAPELYEFVNSLILSKYDKKSKK